MAEQVCYVLPGFLGSRLVHKEFSLLGENCLWFKPWSFSTLALRFMKLTPNQGEDNESQVSAEGVLESFYGELVRFLTPRFSRVVGVGYDFRLSVRANGVRLASFVADDLRPGEVPTFIAHSMGGLVANACLVEGGHPLASKFRNFITLGTPWGGSAAVIDALTGNGSSVRKATALSLLVEGGRFFLSPFYVRQLLATWSGSYDLMPPVELHQAAVAAGVPDHNSAQAWADAGIEINSARLQASAQDRANLRRITPHVVHTAIVGKGIPSPVAVAADKLGADSVKYAADGDGVVPLASSKAWISANSTAVEIEAEHVGLAWDLKAFAAIESILNAE